MSSRTVRVYVKNKKGVLDPQGKTVEGALHSLGYKNVSEMRVGKYIEFCIADKRDIRKQVDEMCRKLLANPVIEEYRFEIQ